MTKIIEGAYEKSKSFSVAPNTRTPGKPEYISAPGDTVLSSENNSFIVLGKDRVGPPGSGNDIKAINSAAITLCAGLGTAITFLFFAPAANILALIDTGGIIGVDLAFARFFLSLAFGIGTSEVEHVLATQTLLMKKSKNMLVRVEGRLQPGSTAKDIILAIIAKIGTAGGTGYTIEFAGEAIRSLSMEGRMTICNMAIEAGARAGIVAVDETTIEYIQGRPYAPKGEALRLALQYWRTLHSDPDAHFDRVVEIRAEEIVPQVSWGTSPEMVMPINGRVPDPERERDPVKRQAMERALQYMGLEPNLPIETIYVDKVFIGSCTNSRIEDLRAAAKVVERLGKKVALNVKQALVVPGSGLVKAQAEREGLDRVFKAAGFEWREPGCSMCLAMNADRLEPEERCASTSNRNFEGRQGAGGRTHLVSPAMAAAAAIEGHFVDVRKIA